MARVSVWNLELQGNGEPVPSVEVDPAGSDALLLACESEIGRALAKFSHVKKPPTATIYLYEGPSVNFGDLTQSLFFGVAGTERVLMVVGAALQSVVRDVRGARARFSDYLPTGRCVPRLHFERGVLWLPVSAEEWESQGTVEL